MLLAPDHKTQEISEYVEWQVNQKEKTDLKVGHLERISQKSYSALNTVYRTFSEPGRWWVITGPTNLYSQELFPSLDYTVCNQRRAGSGVSPGTVFGHKSSFLVAV